jgi:undecaprenyl-diphosphatase
MSLLRRLSSRGAFYARNRGRGSRRLAIHEALALGALQGPTELLPVSSSAHTTLIPWLAGWSYPELDPELRKSFEVALHAGAAVALAIDMRAELSDSARGLTGRRIAVIVLSLAPPAFAGYALEGPIERRLGGPRSIVAGLLAGSLTMALADLRPGRVMGGAPPGREQPVQGEGSAGTNLGGDEGRARGVRRQEDAGPRDGLALGIAQAAALIPGASRNGATLTAARARGFARADAQTLSWHAGLPVILGASVLKGWRLWRNGVPGGAGPALAVGAGGAFLSTAASARLLRGPRTGARSLLPYALYRCTIAAIALVRLRRAQNTSG